MWYWIKLYFTVLYRKHRSRRYQFRHIHRVTYIGLGSVGVMHHRRHGHSSHGGGYTATGNPRTGNRRGPRKGY